LYKDVASCRIIARDYGLAIRLGVLHTITQYIRGSAIAILPSQACIVPLSNGALCEAMPFAPKLFQSRQEAGCRSCSPCKPAAMHHCVVDTISMRHALYCITNTCMNVSCMAAACVSVTRTACSCIARRYISAHVIQLSQFGSCLPALAIQTLYPSYCVPALLVPLARVDCVVWRS